MEKSDNELIAEFMGFSMCETKHDKFFNPPHTPKATPEKWIYHLNGLIFGTSWDWLMPVVEKINNAPFDNMRGIELIETIHKYISKVQIKDAYMYVVEFIKWYKHQTASHSPDSERRPS
jgi:hypothetical protein